MDWIWFLLLGGGIVLGAFANRGAAITDAVLTACRDSITFIIGLLGLVAFWSGLMEIAEQSGLTSALGRRLQPLTNRLFPDIPRDHQAIGAIILSMAANILGIGNAATPLGLRAMEELQRLNPHPETASNSMCTFVAVTTSSLTVIPVTVIGLRIAQGSRDPTAIIVPTLIATTASTITAIALDYLWRRPQSKR